jgi:hypothetical protein
MTGKPVYLCWCACNFEAKVDSVNSPTNKLISFSLACKPEFCFDIVNLSDTVTPDILTWVDTPGCACVGFDDGYEFKPLGIETCTVALVLKLGHADRSPATSRVTMHLDLESRCKVAKIPISPRRT